MVAGGVGGAAGMTHWRHGQESGPLRAEYELPKPGWWSPRKPVENQSLVVRQGIEKFVAHFVVSFRT